MFEKNKKIYIFMCSLGIIGFLLSYTITINILEKSKNGEFTFFGEAKEASSVGNKTVITKDSEIKFILNYKNSLDTVYLNDKLSQSLQVDKSKLIGLNSDEIDEIFSNFGYKVKGFTENEVVLTKNMNCYNYDKDSYFIGINGGFISIMKVDKDDKIIVAEEKIVNPKAGEEAYLQIKDIENKGNLLKSFYEGCKDYQFSNIQDAINYAQALCST